MSELVAVCLPNFNGAPVLASTIEGVLAQTHRELQLVVVDDASTDDSPRVIADLAARDSRIVWHRNEKHLGFASTFNRCLAVAKASFIKPLRQCDRLAPATIECGLQPFGAHSSIRMTAVPWIEPATDHPSGSDVVADLVDFDSNLAKALSSTLPIPGDAIVWGSLFPLRNIVGPLSTWLFYRLSSFDQIDTALEYFSTIDFYSQMLPDGRFCKVIEPTATVEIGRPWQRAPHRSEAGRIAADLIAFSNKNQWLVEAFSQNIGDFTVMFLDLIERRSQSIDWLGYPESGESGAQAIHLDKVLEELAGLLTAPNQSGVVAAEIIDAISESTKPSAIKLNRQIANAHRFGAKSREQTKVGPGTLTDLICSLADRIKARFKN